MNVFEAVQQSVTTRQAAELYGIHVGRNGMACCPFHNDKHPSMKVDKRFHCFGCQADGGVIDFTARLFGLSVKEAAVKLADDFGIHYDSRSHDPPRPRTKPKISAEMEFKKTESYVYNTLCDYLHLLQRWKIQYAPDINDAEWHPRFVEALQRETYVEYLLDDVFLNGSIEDKAAFINEHGKDVIRLEKRIRELASGRTGGRDEDDPGDGGHAEIAAGVRCQHRPAHRHDDQSL